MRLLVITAFYPPHQLGGYGIRCKDVMDRLKKRHVIWVLTTRQPDGVQNGNLEENNIYRVLHRRTEGTNVFKQIFDDRADLKIMDRKIKEFQPDIIYIWAIQNLSHAIFPYLLRQGHRIVYDEGGAGLIYLARIHRRGIYFYKNERDPLIKKFLKNAIYFFAKLISSNLIQPIWSWPANMPVCFNSQSAFRYSIDNGVMLNKTRVIYSGLEIARFPYRARTCLKNPISIILPGRIKLEKGTKDGLFLVKELLKRNLIVNLKIVGNIQSKQYIEELFGTIRKYRLEKNVEILPMVSQTELASIYRSSDICFFSSYFKTGMSRVPLEAMASGCLVITYGNEGSEEIVRAKETGFVLPEGDILSAANCVEDMTNDPSAYQRITQNARKQVEGGHTMEDYICSIELYLRENLPEHNLSTL